MQFNFWLDAAALVGGFWVTLIEMGTSEGASVHRHEIALLQLFRLRRVFKVRACKSLLGAHQMTIMMVGVCNGDVLESGEAWVGDEGNAHVCHFARQKQGTVYAHSYPVGIRQYRKSSQFWCTPLCRAVLSYHL